MGGEEAAWAAAERVEGMAASGGGELGLLLKDSASERLVGWGWEHCRLRSMAATCLQWKARGSVLWAILIRPSQTLYRAGGWPPNTWPPIANPADTDRWGGGLSARVAALHFGADIFILNTQLPFLSLNWYPGSDQVVSEELCFRMA